MQPGPPRQLLDTLNRTVSDSNTQSRMYSFALNNRFSFYIQSNRIFRKYTILRAAQLPFLLRSFSRGSQAVQSLSPDCNDKSFAKAEQNIFEERYSYLNIFQGGGLRNHPSVHMVPGKHKIPLLPSFAAKRSTNSIYCSRQNRVPKICEFMVVVDIT